LLLSGKQKRSPYSLCFNFSQPQADCFLLASSGSWQSNKEYSVPQINKKNLSALSASAVQETNKISALIKMRTNRFDIDKN